MLLLTYSVLAVWTAHVLALPIPQIPRSSVPITTPPPSMGSDQRGGSTSPNQNIGGTANSRSESTGQGGAPLQSAPKASEGPPLTRPDLSPAIPGTGSSSPDSQAPGPEQPPPGMAEQSSAASRNDYTSKLDGTFKWGVGIGTVGGAAAGYGAAVYWGQKDWAGLLEKCWKDEVGHALGYSLRLRTPWRDRDRFDR